MHYVSGMSTNEIQAKLDALYRAYMYLEDAQAAFGDAGGLDDFVKPHFEALFREIAAGDKELSQALEREMEEAFNE